jgi:choline dehydrogenase
VLRGIELFREIGNSQVMKPFVKREIMPGPLDAKSTADFASNAAAPNFVRSGFARWDATACRSWTPLVRPRRGGSPIADAPVVPCVSTGNTMAPTVVIGERMADILLA